MSPTLHPMEKKILERSRQLGLNEQEAELLLNLMGWRNKDAKSFPDSYLGLEPHRHHGWMGASKGHIRLSEDIAQLIRRLIGYDRMVDVNVNPIRTLQDEMGLPRKGVIWLTVQLQLHAKYPEIQDEIQGLLCLAPEIWASRVVMYTLGMLLQIAKE